MLIGVGRVGVATPGQGVARGGGPVTSLTTPAQHTALAVTRVRTEGSGRVLRDKVPRTPQGAYAEVTSPTDKEKKAILIRSYIHLRMPKLTPNP